MIKALESMALVAVACAMVTGCGSESLDDARDDAEPVVSASYVAYDPSNSVLPVPNDLLYSGTTDGTLNLPVDDASDYSDPYVALSAQDGWSTNTPFTIDVVLADDVTIDATSVAGNVRLFETVFGGALAPDECADVASGAACYVESELTYGDDFVASVSGDAIAVVPLKPFKAKTGYLVVLTSGLKDSLGRSIEPSSTYELVKQDITTKPLGSTSQLQLQGLINSFEAAVATQGVDASTIIYSGAMTTQSVSDSLELARLLMAQQLLAAQSGGSSALTLAIPTDAGYTAAQALIASGALDATSSSAAVQQAIAIAGTADVMTSTLTLPYMLEYPDSTTCPLATLASTGSCEGMSSHWLAQGDSPVMILSALSAGTLTASQVVSDCGLSSAADLADVSNLVGCEISGLTDSDGADTQLDTERNLTKYNPLPLIRDWQSVPAVITVPDVDAVNAVRASLAGLSDVSLLPESLTLTKPDAGWPTVIYVHGITSGKETVYALAGTLALQGIATIAIDLPLHGARSVDLTNDGIYELSASTGLQTGASNDPYQAANALVFANLSSLLTVRDNLRQAASDMIALRGGIAYLSAVQAAYSLDITFDTSNVSMVGLSLGSSVTTVAAAIANDDLVDPSTGTEYDNPFVIKTVSLSVPGQGLAGVFGMSPTFGPLVEAGLTASDSFAEAVGMTSDELAALATSAPETYEALLDSAYPAFFSSFAFAAQTAIDAGDAISYATTLAGNTPSIHVMEVVGDGDANLPDQVIPNYTAADKVYARLASITLPQVGTEPLMTQLGVDTGVNTTTGDGSAAIATATRFTGGHHGSLLDPSTQEGIAEDATVNAAVTAEMQSEVASFVASGGTLLTVSNSDVLAAPQ